ncbi:M28 family metallopeptidase [Desulfitobacterium sp. AusDCA]|uniref:M28 family metallopeptidase n=1 Tax=Desulfitobacterium sp. AusDCA TaxID=3240383 RepID=UPI003DA75BEF
MKSNSRRSFLKVLLGLSAICLPWTLWPGKLNKAMQSLIKPPGVNLITHLPELPKGVNNEEVLNRTAMEDIIALSSPEMQGRKAGSVGESKAADYLAKEMSTLGLKPMGDKGESFTHVFTIPPVTEKFVNGRLMFIPGPIGSLRTPSVNLLGGWTGKKQDEVIMITAHYDHLGINQGILYPGANDNASGVSCILDVIRHLLRDKRVPQKTLVFAFWSAEEMGFVGSSAFVQAPTFPLRQIQAVINLDTVGNGMIGDFSLWSEDENNLAFQSIKKAAAEAGASALHTSPGGHNSDQVSFARAGVPAVTLLARDWLNKNHTPEDTAGLIKAEQLKMASDILYRTIQSLAY